MFGNLQGIDLFVSWWRKMYGSKTRKILSVDSVWSVWEIGTTTVLGDYQPSVNNTNMKIKTAMDHVPISSELVAYEVNCEQKLSVPSLPIAWEQLLNRKREGEKFWELQRTQIFQKSTFTDTKF